MNAYCVSVKRDHTGSEIPATMKDLLRDTIFGQCVRYLSGRRLLKYPDEENPDLWKSLISESESNGLDQTGILGNGVNFNVGDIGQQPLPKGRKIPAPGGLDCDAKTEHIVVVNWFDENDRENPQCWPRSRKLLITIQICLLNFGIYIGSSIYTPGEEDIMKKFGVSETVATLGLSFFVLGYGLGPMLFSPMSEIPSIGRSRIYFWTLLAFVLLQLPVGYAVNIEMLLVFRFFTGFFGGPVLATGGATIMDMYQPIEVPYWIGIYGASGVLGPVLGPLVGGFAAQAMGWRWPIWELTWLCGFVVVVIFFLMPETSEANILYRKAQRLRRQTGTRNFKSRSEIDNVKVAWSDHLVVLGRAFTMTFTEPIIFFVDLYCALLYGVLYTWFESFPLVFGDIYQFNIGEQGLAFLGIFVGGILTVPCYLFWIRSSLMVKIAKFDHQPEAVLPPTFLGAIALPICLFWYGGTSRQGVHWIVPLVGSGCFTISIITLFMPVLSYLGMSYPQFAASVLAGNTLFRASCGVVFPLFARALFRNLGIGPGNYLLGGLSIVFLPIPFVLFCYGERIRSHSKNAASD